MPEFQRPASWYREIIKSPLCRTISGGIILLMLTSAASALVCWTVTHPPRHLPDRTPASVGLAYRDVTFCSREDRLEIKGWLLPAANSDRVVIMAHGYRNNRLQDDVPALSLARELVKAGYNVLMFDFRNCGESAGAITSIGQYEVRDLLGAVDFVRHTPGISRRVALLGFSMGAGTAILAAAGEPAVDAVIADSPFADLEKHLKDKCHPLGSVLVPELKLLTGLQPERVAPAKEVSKLASRPLLLVHGEADKVISKVSSEQIWRAAGPAASLWTVPEAGHLKAYAVAGSDYSHRVIGFLDDALR